MKNGCGENGRGAAFGDAFDQMVQGANPTRGDHRHMNRIRDGAGQWQVETRFCAVTIHRGEQDFASALGHHGARELHCVDASGATAAMGEDLPFAGAYGFGINRTDDALAAKLVCGLSDHIRIGHGGRVERDLVGPCEQKRAHVFAATHAPANSERHKALFRSAAHHVKHGAAVFMGGMNIEEGDLICAGGVIGLGGFHRIACIAQANKIDALDHTAISHVKAGNDAGFQHVRVSFCGYGRSMPWGGVKGQSLVLATQGQEAILTPDQTRDTALRTIRTWKGMIVRR